MQKWRQVAVFLLRVRGRHANSLRAMNGTTATSDKSATALLALLLYRLPGERLKPSVLLGTAGRPLHRGFGVDRPVMQAAFRTSCINGEFKQYSTRGGLENSNENQSMSDGCCGFACNGRIDGRLRTRSLRPRSGSEHRNSSRRCPSQRDWQSLNLPDF